MNKTFEQLGFKAGDTVRCVTSDLRDLYKVGDTFTLYESENGCLVAKISPYEDDFYMEVVGSSGNWELVEPVAPEFTSTDIYSAHLSSRNMTERLLLAYSDKGHGGSDYNLNLVKEELVELVKRLETINIKLNSEIENETH